MNDTPYVVVIGGANMDLHAIADVELVPGSSNAGSSELSPGGVGRNVAEVIARLNDRRREKSSINAGLSPDEASPL